MAVPPRKRWGRRLAYAAGAAIMVGGTGAAIGPAAPWIVDQLADGRRVWRLGNIEIDGVRGGWLGALRAERVQLADEDGVWIEARNVALEWSPFSLLLGDVSLGEARAASISILRQPTLSERRPSGNTRFDVHIGSLVIDSVDVSEAALGEAAQFRADVSMDLRARELQLLDVELERLDSDADRASIFYRPDEAYALNVDIESAQGGILARALGVGEQGLRVEAQGEGDATRGLASYSAHVGEEQLLSGEANWNETRWRAAGEARLSLLPALRTLARRIGSDAAFVAEGERAGRFTLDANTEFIELQLTGDLDEDRQLEGAAHFVATTQRLSDIAREAPFDFGAARLEGELRQGRDTWAIRANLDAQDISAFGRSTRLSGPVEAALTRRRFTLTADLRAPERTAPLFAQARLRTELSYDRRERRFELQQASLGGDAVSVDAQGWARRGEGEFAGEWRVRDLGAFVGDLRGSAAGRWRSAALQQGQARVWTTTFAGVGDRVAGAPEILPQLLGNTPRLDAMLRNEQGGITVSHARIDGQRLRAGATGRIVRGVADLNIEASARGPLIVGGAQIDGAVDATGRLTGRLARPALAVQAAMSSFSSGGAIVTNPRVNFTLAPSGDAYVGRADVQGQVSGQAMAAQGNVSIRSQSIALSALTARIGALNAEGSGTIASGGVTANLAVNGAMDGLIGGVTGQVTGNVALTPQTLALDVQIADARAGELRVRAANVRARGPLHALAATYDLRGRLRQAPLTLAGTGTLNIDASAASLDGRGTLAAADIFTRAPIELNWRDGFEASLNVAMADGVVMAQWRDRRRALSGSAQIEDAPLAPLAAIWGERATGRIDGRIQLTNSGGGLSGNANLTLDDARFAGRQRGTLDMRIVGELTPSRLRGTVDAQSTDGLVAHFEADAPVVTDADPIRIALAPERRGRATWTVQGPAQSLWAAARLQDQSLEGQLDGRGELAFGAGYLSGSGYVQIVDGRFEDKLTGVTLVDLDARVGIGDDGIRIENFTAAGPRGGRLTASGGSATNREGRIVVTLDEMRVADRPEARAIASGELTLVWEGLHASLDGDLSIIEANVDIATNPEAGIPTLDVIEINRPGEEDETAEDESSLRNGSTALNVRVRAPGRVFTRGRGVDAEWSLDLRLTGTRRDPRVFGTARIVRGTLALSGQPFEISEARIDFNGDPLDASIDLTAERSTADLTAYLHLDGTARDPEISFTSDPGLPEDEILPQVLFGRSVEDLSGLEAAQLAASLAALSGRSSLDIVDAARAAAGLDRFNVRQDENGGFLVAGGVYLTREVYVEVARTGLGQAQTRLEWTIRPRLVLITSFLSNGDQRVSLRWRRETD